MLLGIPWTMPTAYLVHGVQGGPPSPGIVVSLLVLGALLPVGGTVVAPEVVRRLLRRRRDPLERLSEREREVPAETAEGHSDTAIARRLFVSEAAVGKHIASTSGTSSPSSTCRRTTT